MIRCVAIASVILVAATGCGSGLHPVRGVVTMDGQPLAGAGIVFTSLDGSTRSAVAETGPDGTFTLKTNTPGDGVMPGEYAVTIVWEEPPHPYTTYREGSPKQKELEKDYLDWKSKHKAVASKVGSEYANPATTPLKVTVPVARGEVKFDLTATK